MTFTPRSGAVVLALGSTLGAGVLTGFAPAVAGAGPWFLPALVVAALAALCSAMSTADQHQVYPEGTGATRVRAQFGLLPSWIAASAHVVGRAGVVAAVASAFAVHVLPQYRVPVAAALVVLAVALGGVAWPARLTPVAVAFVVGVLVLVAVVCLAVPPPANPASALRPDVMGVLGGACVLFAAFTGFERVTSPGRDERAFDPRALKVAVPVLFAVLLALYALVGHAVLRQLGPDRLALSKAPLRDALVVADGRWLVPLLAVGAAVAAVSVLRSALVGARRTLGSVTSVRGRLPLDVVNGALAVAAVVVLQPATALAVGGCATAVYYGFTNAAARLLAKEDRTWPARTACFGLGLSVVLAVGAPTDALVVTGVGLVVGTAALALGRPRAHSR
ncbi:amino acid permease [Actinosynnema sp. NPDC020468]|uniref:amino acid permease n=1 Tax=Actinosynnema sp. NPDC020468 TaxID=3154488 RepID=UPI003400BF3D